MSAPQFLCAYVLLIFVGIPNLPAQSLKVYYIDVEQGASTLLVSPSGKTLLIDAGRNGHGPRIKQAMQHAGVNRIDHFVVTHYHDDHYGGIDELAKDPTITIAKVYDRGEKAELDAADRAEVAFINYQTTVGQNAEHLTRGKTIALDPAMVVTCVASGGIVDGEVNPIPGADENDKSIALYIQFGDFRFFTGGDIELTTEGKIAARDLVLDVDVYQASHHGSHTSSSLPLMEDLRPTVVIISNGNRADYQHPRKHTLDLLSGLTPKPKIFQTNKYFKGKLGGNVSDEFIADLESTEPTGTIIVTVDLAARRYLVSYRDEGHAFPIRERGTSGHATSPIVISSLVPDPTNGPDTTHETVTLRNRSAAPVSMIGWLLKDRNKLAWALESLGNIEAGQSKVMRRNGMPMSLNNDGDKISLFGPGGELKDEFEYSSSTPSTPLSTGH